MSDEDQDFTQEAGGESQPRDDSAEAMPSPAEPAPPAEGAPEAEAAEQTQAMPAPEGEVVVAPATAPQQAETPSAPTTPAAPPVEPIAPPPPQYAPPPPPPPGTPTAPYVPPTPVSSAVSEKNKVVAGVLGILLGSLGIHKFYLGYNKEGLIMLAITVVAGLISGGIASGVMSIIGIVEGVLYLMKTDEEFYATYVAGSKPWF